MVTFGLNYDVKPGAGPEFERVTREAVKALQGIPGHKLTRLYQDVDDRNSYLIYSDWESRETFMAFIHSDAFKAVQGMGGGLLSRPPRHQVYNREEMG